MRLLSLLLSFIIFTTSLNSAALTRASSDLSFAGWNNDLKTTSRPSPAARSAWFGLSRYRGESKLLFDEELGESQIEKMRKRLLEMIFTLKFIKR